MTTHCQLSTQGNGFEELLEQIVKIGNDIDGAADRALTAGAEIIQEEMQGLAPVDKGNLRAHIKIDGPHQDGHYHTINIGVIHKLEFTDKKTAIYGNVQEYGSAHVQAHPYIRPGFLRARRRALDAMKQSLTEDGIL